MQIVEHVHHFHRMRRTLLRCARFHRRFMGERVEVGFAADLRLHLGEEPHVPRHDVARTGVGGTPAEPEMLVLVEADDDIHWILFAVGERDREILRDDVAVNDRLSATDAELVCRTRTQLRERWWRGRRRWRCWCTGLCCGRRRAGRRSTCGWSTRDCRRTTGAGSTHT